LRKVELPSDDATVRTPSPRLSRRQPLLGTYDAHNGTEHGVRRFGYFDRVTPIYIEKERIVVQSAFAGVKLLSDDLMSGLARRLLT